MRIVFMGTPDFAVPSLERLISDGHDIAAVYTKQDRPKNRGMKLGITPVKELALQHGLAVRQPESFKNPCEVDILVRLEPELIVVVAYGIILPKAVLDIPPLGCVNVHGSILPKYRGAAPIQRAVLDGETKTGISTMLMDEGLDTGDILEVAEAEIFPYETSGMLHDRLKLMGAELLSSTVKKLGSSLLEPRKQDDSLSSYASMLSKSEAPIDWSLSAMEIHNHVRGMNPWPLATAVFGDKTFKIFNVEIGENPSSRPAGEAKACEKGIEVACGKGEAVIITCLQAPGGKKMAAADYLRGNSL